MEELKQEYIDEILEDNFNKKSLVNKIIFLKKKFIGEKLFENKNKTNEFIQTRHIIVHNQGIVDEDYKDNTKNREFKVGEKRELSKNYIEENYKLIRKMVTKIYEVIEEKYL